jgi:hypothetical protein
VPEQLGRRLRLGEQAEPQDAPLAGPELELVVRGGLGAAAGVVDGVLLAVDHVVVEPVLDEPGRVLGCAEHPLHVRLVVREQPLGRVAVLRRPPGVRRVGLEPDPAERHVVGQHAVVAVPLHQRLEVAPLVRAAPAPGVAEPEGREHVQVGRVRAAVLDRDPDQHVVRPGLGVLGVHVEVPPAVEHAGVLDLVLPLGLGPPGVHVDQLLVRELGLRVLVQRLEVRAGRGGVEVPPELLRVLAVVALGVGQAEQPLLEDRVLPVPEGEREAEPALAVGDAEQPVLAPPVRPAAGVVVREVGPGVPVGE